jgi:hypothetical protein
MMSTDTNQILILLILINVALCSYYFLLHKDTQNKKEEDKFLNYLDDKFSNGSSHNLEKEKNILHKICNPFHDKFFDNNKYLGWRLFYLKNQNNKLVEPDTNFDGTITKNYLTNMASVINEVTPSEYQIR